MAVNAVDGRAPRRRARDLSTQLRHRPYLVHDRQLADDGSVAGDPAGRIGFHVSGNLLVLVDSLGRKVSSFSHARIAVPRSVGWGGTSYGG